MIYHKRDDGFSLDDIVLSEFDESSEQLQHLINVDCALALSICKTRNLPSCVFVLSLLYMKRIRCIHSSILLTKIDSLTTQELYLIATLLADKYLIDEGETEQIFNSELLELAGINNKRIKLIERQVLLALNWNLHVTNDEFKQFFSLFKTQIKKNLNKKLELEDAFKFYSICFNLLPHLIEYLALTSLFLVGSTLTILTAIHIGTLTHSTLMKTIQPTMNCPHTSWNNHEKINSSQTEQNNPWIINKTTDNNHDFDISLTHSSRSMNIIRSPSFSRSLVESFG